MNMDFESNVFRNENTYQLMSNALTLKTGLNSDIIGICKTGIFMVDNRSQQLIYNNSASINKNRIKAPQYH
ncbi:hypothetical protein EC465_17705 [Salmonella enterica subsp. enterica serovar Muenchen]|nr:hypothetical protein [Salmonella enterica subsp. enterica serovar Bonn]EBZ5939344.1 hypothetical protein [Salmonella enterica subsp. enterica serovar Muenchen]